MEVSGRTTTPARRAGVVVTSSEDQTLMLERDLSQGSFLPR